MEAKDSLRQLGLSENEISVYSALLKLGESKVQAISKYSGLPRTTAYYILDSLVQKGIVSSTSKESTKWFQGVPPRQLLRQLDEKREALKEALPEISKWVGVMREKPQMELYEGVSSIMNIFEDMLQSSTIIMGYGSSEPLYKVLGHRFVSYVMKRVERKIPTRILCTKMEKPEGAKYLEYAILPPSYDIPSILYIYSNNVAIISLETEPYYAILIKDKNFFRAQETLFNILWDKFKKK